MEEGIKKVVIFGSTGFTGSAALQCALQNGYEVTVFVRDPSKLSGELKPHNVVTGNALNLDDVNKAVAGQDAVVIILGTRNDLSPTTELSDCLKNIIEAMKVNGVKRVTCCLSSFLFWEKGKVPPQYGPITEDHQRMLNILKSSDREWIALLPPHIDDVPALGTYTLKNDGPVGHKISKYDLASILVKCLTMKEHIGHAVGMGYP